MKLDIPRKALIMMLDTLIPATGKRMEVLSGILLKSEGGTLSGTATNLEQALTTTVKAIVKAKGIVLVKEPRTLLSYCRAVSAERLIVSTSAKGMEVQAGSTKGTFKLGEVKDYPAIPVVKAELITAYDLAEAIGRVKYAVCKEESRPPLNCLHVEPGAKNGIELAAADGFRLAITTVKTRGKLTGSINLPMGAVNLLSHFTGTVKMAMKVTETKRKVYDRGEMKEVTEPAAAAMFCCGNTTLITQGQMGNYPNYRQLIPTAGTSLTADRTALKAAVKTIAAMKPKGSAIRLQTKGRKLVVWGLTDDDARVETVLAAKGTAKIAFNVAYVHDVLNAQDGPFVLKSTTPSAPAMTKDKVTTHVIMPLFIQWEPKPEVFNGVMQATPVAQVSNASPVPTRVPVAAGNIAIDENDLDEDEGEDE